MAATEAARRNSGRDSPFSIRNEFAEVDLGDDSSEGGKRGRSDGERVVATAPRRTVGEERPATSSSIWTCCLCCRPRGIRPVNL